MKPFKTFVVPYDFSEHAGAALDVALDLARRLEADLHLVHVIHTPAYAYAGYASHGQILPPPKEMSQVQQQAARALDEVASGLEDAPGQVEARVLEGVGVANMICEAAEELEADLIVMGTHGRTGLAHVFLGSVAERTPRKARCPVLSVQAPEDESRG